MMGARRQSWWTPKILIVFGLLVLTETFKLTDESCNLLSPEVAFLQRLRRPSDSTDKWPLSDDLLLKAARQREHFPPVPTRPSRAEVDPDVTLKRLDKCDDFLLCVHQLKQDFNSFLASLDEQKIHNHLLGASEIAHSYSQKLLVMTDEDASTSERAQQEYILDPLQSVIVGKACLLNDSCSPAADSYTVVKIFGKVSDDGQTVSGLSGFSLATLMLTPSLEAAPVFYLDGNTTKEFHHNFLRVFFDHGSSAVLETNLDNQQVYHVIGKSDSGFSFVAPQRPVDPTTQYDHQQIIILEDNPVVRKAADYLYNKHPKVSSVYMLDENRRPKLIYGESAPLSEGSRLVLVGHGARDSLGQTKLSRFSPSDVANVIHSTDRVSDTIKTTRVVACYVGEDPVFVEKLVREIHATGIKTELRLCNGVIQVTQQGHKVTTELTQDGLEWRKGDHSKKVVAIMDNNGKVIIRNQPGSRGEPFFTTERNVLMDKQPRDRFVNYRFSWPDGPMTFIDQNAYEKFRKNIREQMKNDFDILEAMTWALFNPDLPPPKKVDTNNLQDIKDRFVIQDKKVRSRTVWINDEEKLNGVLSKCYEINSAQDVRNLIRHYAKTGEDVATYLMVNDWIYIINPENLYIELAGKRLSNNQIGEADRINEVKGCISEQENRKEYRYMTEQISDKSNYVEFVRDVFHGEHPSVPRLSTEAWYTTYFAASVICESSRNFRTFPLTLMALDMAGSADNNIKMYGEDFFFTDHPMARGRSWIDPSRRGFSGSATPLLSSKLDNYINQRTLGQLMRDLTNLLELEHKTLSKWKGAQGEESLEKALATLANDVKMFESVSKEKDFIQDYNHFTKHAEQYRPAKKPAGPDRPSTSGILGGYQDSNVLPNDLNSAIELEKSFKLKSYYSRASESILEQIHSELKAKYGDSLAGLRVEEGSVRMENGEFICELVSAGAEAKAVEFRVQLSPESQRYNERMLEGLDEAIGEMETPSLTPAQKVSKAVEHTGVAIGTLGLMLGMKGAVDAFERGDVKDGVIGSLQTFQGVSAMTTSVIAKQALSSETRVAKAAATIMRSPAMKGAMTVIPIVGIGFGIYNLEQDLQRRDALGYVDAALDFGTVALDIVEIFQPELAPFLAPINLALSVVRMVVDDIYMGVQEELKSLPKDASVLQKLCAVSIGIGEGIKNFASVFYDWHYADIEQGHKLVTQIADYHKYYDTTKEQDGTTAVDFTAGASSWNGGSIHFCLADEGQSEFCMDHFVSSDESFRKRCWMIDTQGSKDIILGLGESHQLEYTTLQKKVLWFIPAGSVTVVSGYKAVSNSRYGTYKGNQDANRFFAVQKSEDKATLEMMLSYYYQLYGKPGDDTFFLGPQKSYVEGSGGKDTYIIPENGGKTIINNYEPSMELDTLHFSVDYSDISVSKSNDDLVFMYEDSHTVTIQNWYVNEMYRHMHMLSKDGILFQVSSAVLLSVELVPIGINRMFKKAGETIDASQPLYHSVTNIFGTQFNDVIIGNGGRNVIDGGGGEDHLTGAEGEDTYLVQPRERSSVVIENFSNDTKTDLAIVEAHFHSFAARVEGESIFLYTVSESPAIHMTLLNWFRSPQDRHLLIITKDLITFTISDKKAECLQLTKCIKSLSIDYSSSSSPLVVDLQYDGGLENVTEVRGSQVNDIIKGNKENNVFFPGKGDDFIEGREGEDWYVITPGEGVKTINNQSPDLAVDVLFLKEQYELITGTCEGQNIVILMSNQRNVVLQNWFSSRHNQHLQIKTSDGVIAELKSDLSDCGRSVVVALTIDRRSQEAERIPPPNPRRLLPPELPVVYQHNETEVCLYRNTVIVTISAPESVGEMYGHQGFDIMVGNSKANVLDPYIGGGLMSGRNGKDTYIIQQGYTDLMIDNLAEDMITDTVWVDMDFMGGSRIAVMNGDDVDLTITTKGKQLKLKLINYNVSSLHQHLEFRSSDGVIFELKSRNQSGAEPHFEIEALKVVLKESQLDCRLDLGSHTNLSTVRTVEGCPLKSNNLLGNDQNNALIGGSEDDALDGGQGDDTLIGGNGTDLLIGGMGDDTLYGEDGNDTMMGNSGQDVLIPGPGADLLDGGAGRDTVLYQGDHQKGQGVYVNLLSGQGRYADAEGDVLKDVENVIGTIYSDILVSGYESSLLKGSDGNDVLVSTGWDYLVGGEGHDIYMMAFDQGSVTIDNCAKDNALDVLYFPNQLSSACDCDFIDNQLTLSLNFSTGSFKVVLKGWRRDNHGCGHLALVFRNREMTVEGLLRRCNAHYWSYPSLFRHKIITCFEYMWMSNHFWPHNMHPGWPKMLRGFY